MKAVGLGGPLRVNQSVSSTYWIRAISCTHLFSVLLSPTTFCVVVKENIKGITYQGAFCLELAPRSNKQKTQWLRSWLEHHYISIPSLDSHILHLSGCSKSSRNVENKTKYWKIDKAGMYYLGILLKGILCMYALSPPEILPP